jgi:hypothetical protein
MKEYNNKLINVPIKRKRYLLNESNDIEYLYYNINRRVIADSKENVIINKIDKEKLKAELTY